MSNEFFLHEIMLFLTAILVFLGMCLPVIFAAKISGRTYSQVMIYVGLFYILIYAVSVSIPFHFQGYNELLAERCFRNGPLSGDGLGWHKYSVINLFGYALSFRESGYAWLSFALAFVVFGESFVGNKKVNLAIKFILLLTVCGMLGELESYSLTINQVLE